MQIYQDELSTDLFSSFANWQICEMFSSLFSYLPMLELLSWSYCYLFVYSFIYLFLYSKTHSLLIHKLHVMRSDKYSHNIYNGIFLDLYLKWKWYCEKWVITTFILLRSHQAIQIFISKRIPQKKKKRKKFASSRFKRLILSPIYLLNS